MKRDDLKLPKTYKTVLMLALVFGPFFWLAFTEDGQRRTDLALMFVFGKPEFNAALDTFGSDLTEAKLRETFHKLELQCADGRNPFGDRICGAEIGAFNQIPASSLTLFFERDGLRATKVQYRRAYHEMVRGWVKERVAAREPSPLAARFAEQAEGVMVTPVEDGVLVLREGELGKDEEPALMWLSQAAINTRR
ncbi:hypothetical protein G3480_07055 [Thiorhodococcus mannitoliphagus]|uniref:Uncharacterized protein n=1 Tax=Thiorhodococcus mannitoliphagus TaxID=329406 RepID=A0A6P1DWL8_9GAMM|nr:hypothetical protein [Thiorhodococcus mannitoliphagus]NEX20074.1 hypothetical protein [Thiorhodococcus mannitoliphagus]